MEDRLICINSQINVTRFQAASHFMLYYGIEIQWDKLSLCNYTTQKSLTEFYPLGDMW